MAKEWWTTPGEAQRRLDTLVDYFNGLRNAALGRGTTPLVPAPLADEVAAEWEAFKRWRETLGGFTAVSSWADELGEWTARGNRLRARIAEAGAAVPAPAIEWEAQGLGGIVATAFSGLGGLALALAAAFVLSRRGR